MFEAALILIVGVGDGVNEGELVVQGGVYTFLSKLIGSDILISLL